MKKLVMGCAVVGLMALSPRTEARLPTSSLQPLELIIPHAQSKYGLASWYGEAFQGNVTASGESYDMNKLTAAHRELPLGTRVRVTNLRNQRTILLRVNDRGPSPLGRMIDVSREAARRLGFLCAGLAPVEIEVVSYPKEYMHSDARPQAAGVN